MFYWFLKVFALGPLLRTVFRPWVDGLENVPREGPAIFASNHLSFSDSVWLPLVLPRRITFPAKIEYFIGTGIKGRLTALFFRGIGQVPIDRTGGRASQVALDAGHKLLQKGELFGIYPEGTRSPDGRLYKGKTGVARLALASGAPVIPVAMIGTDKMQPPGKALPKLMRPGVRIGKPLDFSRYEGMEEDRFVLRSVTDEIMYELMELSGQEYVDMYAQKAKDELGRRRGGDAGERSAGSSGTPTSGTPTSGTPTSGGTTSGGTTSGGTTSGGTTSGGTGQSGTSNGAGQAGGSGAGQGPDKPGAKGSAVRRAS